MRGGLGLLLALVLAGSVVARVPDAAEQARRLAAAKRAAVVAQDRAVQLMADAARVRGVAERAEVRERAMAARVEAAAADVRAAQARVALIDRLREAREARLADQQAPVARLLAAVQGLATRPMAATLVQPGSVSDLVHGRAVLASTLPAIHARTEAVRRDIAAARVMRARADVAAQALVAGRRKLEVARQELAATAAGHRARAQAIGRTAIGEADRALAMGEAARDLVDRMAQDGAAQATASDLAALPAPVARPLAPGVTGSMPEPGTYRLPVRDARLVSGFGELSSAGVRARGLTLATEPRAPVVAPADGVVRYARRYRGYGDIVILDHGAGWTSLVTGLGALAVRPGTRVAAGTPLGRAGEGESPRVSVELRRRGQPVDIAALLG
ncbi:murein hydrolase activator EnvC [Sphingomonas sp.]|uniref:murein hydrolase activator EnvC family protein n=1 Tax=Sphingomonas sp. TaxID=28214 RepID=UPI0035ADB2D5